ncbi:hypothetical protein SAMN05877809_1015 [Rhodobacter sp. JA431]|uniref:hypothetical protein n=1 Tax=Rhodobacter sp. JA431 TaxID=570013 RepID=UPI000BCAF67F|nr:hypothetical protein [Rhodobacter sp. JA431]SOB89430.1 hypothetical protein SAMN05877809_1015 [Rhodobacter sp. JA431]
MKKLLATTAVALVAMAGAASAQSVLERVLSEIDNSTNLASVNGTFANIAENIGGVTLETQYTIAGDSALVALAGGAMGTDLVLSEDQYAQIDAMLTGSLQAGITEGEDGTFTVSGNVGTTQVPANAFETREAAEAYAALVVDNFMAVNTTAEEVASGNYAGIDGSITNVVNGVSDAVASATQMASVDDTVVAYEWNLPTTNFGDMSTTVLGAVNTGDITLGVNQAVDEAKTSTTGAYSAVVDQLGGSADTGAIVLNIASNMTGVNGSISTTMADVNGTVGAAATTVLGAVNTGTIVSGVNAAVSGIVSTGTEQLAN